MNHNPLILIKAAAPPPRGGRNFFENGINAENAAFISGSRIPADQALRHLAAERGANTTHRDGEYAGNSFALRSTSRRAPLWLRLYQATLITVALICAACAGYALWREMGGVQ